MTLDKTGFFNDFNQSSKELNISENYFNASDEFVLLGTTGFIDTYNSNAFGGSVIKFIGLKPRKVVVMDVTGTNYMSSTGIGAFAGLLKYCREKEIKLYIMGLQPNIHEVFQLLGFTSFFNFISDLKDIKEEKIARAHFPMQIKCPFCSASLNVPKVGSFKCLQCTNIFRVQEKNGETIIEKRS